MHRKLRVYLEMSVIAVWTILKRVFIFASLLVLGWLTYSIFISHFINGSRVDQIIAFFVVWFVGAYVFLPRVHRVLTKLYIPDYFIGRIRTSDGLLSDPVNLALIGDEKKLHTAMQSAGWLLADKLSFSSSVRMIVSTLLRRSYPKAPVSSAFLFNEKQSFTYQQEIDNNPFARHHVRFWKVPDGWLMPGGHKVDWVAAGTFDRSIGFSYFTLQITHRIVSDTDIERDYIVETLKSTNRIKNVKVIQNYFSAYHHRNGGGDSITTDGSLPIVEL